MGPRQGAEPPRTGPGRRGGGASRSQRLAAPWKALPLLAGVLLGCQAPEVKPSDPELREALDLSADVAIHRVNVGGRGGEVRFVPRRLEVAQGAVVQFLLTDRRLHVIRFAEDELDAEARDFLRRTEQARSPPLVDPGARFVVSFKDAPPGEYPFESEGHGGPERGVVVVNP